MDNTNATYKTIDAQRKTTTEEPPWNGQREITCGARVLKVSTELQVTLEDWMSLKGIVW